MLRNTPHIYEHFLFEGTFRPENISVRFNSDTLIFAFTDDAEYTITLERVFEIIHDGHKVTRKDLH